VKGRNWSSVVDGHLSNALGTGDLAVLLGNRFRLENVAQEIDSREEAAALAEQANATLIIWGVMDAAALEVTIQANGYPEGAVDRAGFTLPRDENFAARLVDSVPAGVSIYSQIMMLNRMMQQGDGVVMVGLLLNWSEEMVNIGEKIVPSTPLDGYLLEITQAFVAKEYEQADAATTNALAIAPNDITLYNWRYVINAMFLGRNERAQADIQRLYELMPDNPMPVFDDMLLAYINSNHEEVLRITADVPWDNTNQINFIILLYRIMAIYSLGDFETALEETNRWISLTEGMDIRQTIISMEPMRALIYETLGDEESAEADKVFARSNRGLDMTTQSLNLFPSNRVPPILMLFGGYLNEVNSNTTFAAFAYQAGLNAAPDDYLLNWRLAVLSEQQGNNTMAYQHYVAALENAPVPFPIASYQLALLSQEYDTETDACELLAQAEEEANTNLNLYALLLEKISTAQRDFQCE
jgi:tetratricopeptide (TPR) repeat protein